MPDPAAAPGAQTRPEVVVFVAGTGTEVGKTWAAAALRLGSRR